MTAPRILVTGPFALGRASCGARVTREIAVTDNPTPFAHRERDVHHCGVKFIYADRYDAVWVENGVRLRTDGVQGPHRELNLALERTHAAPYGATDCRANTSPHWNAGEPVWRVKPHDVVKPLRS